MQTDVIVTWISYIHKNHPIVGVLFFLMLLDVVIGICAAFVTKSLSSSISHNGMIRKVIKVLLVGVAAVLDPYAGEVPVSKLTAMFFIVTEGISILENSKRAGVPIPEVLSDALIKLKNGEKHTGTSQPSQQVQISRASNVDIHTTDAQPGGSGIQVVVREKTNQ